MARWQTVRKSVLGCQCTLHRAGPASGLPIVALHGFTGGGLDFDALADRLEGARWIAPDLPGHGGTGYERGTDLDRCAALIAAIGAAEFPGRRPALLGYSMGGRVALRAAVGAIGSWGALIAIGATPGIEDERARAERAASDEALARRIESIGTEAFLREWSAKPIIATQAAIEERYAGAMRARRLAQPASGWASALCGYGTGRMESLWGTLSDLRLDALLIAGARDAKFSAIARRAAARMPRGDWRAIEGAGHAAHLEAPDETARAIASFLEGTTPNASARSARTGPRSARRETCAPGRARLWSSLTQRVARSGPRQPDARACGEPRIEQDAMTKILLVEDNEMNRDMLARRLKRRGYEVVVAVDGQAGIEMARSESPDLILMDLSLPIVDGWTATSRIKASDETRAIPVIALTAHAMTGDREKALEAGCDEFDTKPVELGRLLSKIEQLLGVAGQA